MKKAHFLLAFLGLALGTILVARFGVGQILQAVTSVGLAGFLALVTWQALLFVILGLAWRCLLPGSRAVVPIWGRMVRDAAGNCLPLSQIGGYVFGARALAMQGVAWPRAAASTMVDVTTEFFAQLLFALIGLLMLLARQPHSHLILPVACSLGLGVLGGAGFIWAQKDIAPILRRIVTRIAGDRLLHGAAQAGRMQQALDDLYRQPGRIITGIAVHLAGWLAAGIGSWIIYHLLHAPIDLGAALIIEALLSVTLNAAFAVPGYVGVQEAALAALGDIFGLPAELSIAVSLLRRGRDLATGLPVLLIWQLLEARGFRRRASSADMQEAPSQDSKI